MNKRITQTVIGIGLALGLAGVSFGSALTNNVDKRMAPGGEAFRDEVARFNDGVVVKVTAVDAVDAARAALIDPQVAGTLSAAATANANGGTNVVVVTAKNLASTTLAINNQAVLFRCYIADTAFGAVSAVAGEFAVSGGTEIAQVTDKGDYIVATATNGVVTLTITDTPPMTNYLHCVTGGGRIVAPTRMTFVAE